jgi:BirA family biotin operon repressor/biotin-[acetyl-CoA-carboxylase] ligase
LPIDFPGYRKEELSLSYAESLRSAALHELASGGTTTVEWLDEIDSTNDAMKRAVDEARCPPLPWLLVADRQSGGRGRSANRWWSPDGCLMFSLMLKFGPEIHSRITQLPLVVGIAIAKAVRRCVSRPVFVKWPNDVYVGEKKLAGILIESLVGPSGPVWILGVGLNVSVDFARAAEEIRGRATSLHLESKSASQSITCESVLLDVMQSIYGTIDDWKGDAGFLSQLWPEYCLLSGRRIRISVNGDMMEGRCEGIDELGGLMIEDDHGIVRRILSGVIEDWNN